MTEAERIASLAQTKQALAQKYWNLARVSKSKPKRERLLRQSEKYRQQAIELSKR